jgi:hypothetical protein
MPIEVMEDYFESWADPNFAHKLAVRLEKRLITRMKGRKFVMITLTYDPSQYANPAECHNDASLNKHVSQFVKDLAHELCIFNGQRAKSGQRLGAGLFAGRWFCKMEFTEQGWPHYHLLFDYRFIPKECVDAAWERGYCRTEGVDSHAGAAKYVAKYNAKGSEWPAWALEQRPRSVRIVRVSRGFWDPPDSGSEVEEETAVEPEEAELVDEPALVGCSCAFVPYAARLRTRGVRVLQRSKTGHVRNSSRYGVTFAALVACLGAAYSLRPGVARGSVASSRSYSGVLGWAIPASHRVAAGESLAFDESNRSVALEAVENWACGAVPTGGSPSRSDGLPVGLSQYEWKRHCPHAKPHEVADRSLEYLLSLGEFAEVDVGSLGFAPHVSNYHLC